MAVPAEPTIRRADPADVDAIAALHAESWRRHYRGAYSDAFLDGDVRADRLAVWSQRLGRSDEATRSSTLVAELAGAFAGFVHVVFDHDPHWGSLVDNLHVVWGRKRSGIGRRLLGAAADAVVARGDGGLYLWVLEQNTDAQAFYAVCGGRWVERGPVTPPGGRAEWLAGSPMRLRYAWNDAAAVGKSRSLT